MAIKLFIDDERHPPIDGGNWAIVRSSQSAMNFVQSYGCPSFISFDHDLGGDDTAMIFVKWLIEYDLDHPRTIPVGFSYYVHSQNPIGKASIIGLLDGYLKQRA